MHRSGTIILFQVSLLIAVISCNPILVRWDEFALCLRRRLKRNFSPNIICATRKMALNFRRSIRCPSCELFFHCQANYEAIFHCSQAAEAIQTAEVFSDCREFAQLGGPPSGVSARQEANLIGRRGGDCVGEYLTKTPDFSLATVLGLGNGGRCQWNPLEGVCGSTAGEVIASADYPPLSPSTSRPQTFHRPTYSHHHGNPQPSSSGYPLHSTTSSDNRPFNLMTLINFTQPLLSGFGQKPPEKAPGILETLQALNVIKDKLPAFSPSSSSSSIASHTDTNSVVLESTHLSKPNTIPSFGPISVDDFGKPYIPLMASNQDSTHSDKKPLLSIPVMNPLDTSGPFDASSGNGAGALSETDNPWLSSIASAFGSFFGKPPVLPGHPGQSSNLRVESATAPQQRPEPVPIPLNAPPEIEHSLPAELFDKPANKVSSPTIQIGSGSSKFSKPMTTPDLFIEKGPPTAPTSSSGSTSKSDTMKTVKFPSAARQLSSFSSPSSAVFSA